MVTLDDTGTPLRSKAFHSARYGQPDSMSGRLEDHIAAIQQLAAQHPCTPPEVCLGAQPAGKGLVVALDAGREHASSLPLCGLAHRRRVDRIVSRLVGEWCAGMDTERVGITGASGGGLASTRAILQFPEFFKVAVSFCGK